MEGKHIKLIDVIATSIGRQMGNLPAFHLMCVLAVFLVLLWFTLCSNVATVSTFPLLFGYFCETHTGLTAVCMFGVMEME